VHAQVRLLLNGFLQLAAQLRLADANRPRERVSSESLRGAALDCLRRWRNDERVGRGALAVVIAGEWAQNLARMEEDLERPVAIAAQSARLPWWR
jgi:hypothetical protein